jgi:hypothetical protein
LYAFFNRKFRVGFKAIITSRSCCKPLRYNNELGASVKSNYSCRTNGKNGSVLVARMSVTQSNVAKSKGNNVANNLHRHNSASAVGAMRNNKRSVSYKESYSRSCRVPSSELKNSHNIIRSPSLSALSHTNATSV